MTTTLLRSDSGVFEIGQARRRYTRPVTLKRQHPDRGDWQLFDGEHGCWRFTTFAEAKVWLLGADGQAWLDQLPRAEVTA